MGLLDSAATTLDGAVERFPHLGRRPFRLGIGAGAPFQLARVAIDSSMLVLAAVATGLGAEAAGAPSAGFAWTGAFCLLVMLRLATRGLYSPILRLRALDDLRTIVAATSLVALALIALAAFADAGQAPVDEVVRLWAFSTAYVTAGRTALYWSQVQARRSGEGLRPTLIVGAGNVGRLAARRLLESPQLGLKPIGFLDKDPLARGAEQGSLPVLGASWDLEGIVREHAVEQVIVTFSTAPNDVLLRLVRRCEELGVAVAMVPRLYEQTTTRMTVEHIGGLPLVSAHPADPRGLQFAVKYSLDRVVSAALILLVSPLLVSGAIATYLSLGRPIFFRQRRVGRDGVVFNMLKFRTMHGAPEQRGEVDAVWARRQLHQVDDGESGAVADDPCTRVGSFLRKTSLDELPQLFNVLLGHMSLVGPRPERVQYVRAFEQTIYRYGDRHRVKSGITGWAQVNGLRGQTSLSDRVEWDNHYIANFSIWLDLKIMLLTVAAIFTAYASSSD